MSRFTALVLTIFVLAIIDTWLFGFLPATLHLQVWMSFIAWGVHFMAGGKVQGAKAAVLSMSFGALVGMCAAMAIPSLGALGALGAPLAVGVGAAVIVLASKIPMLEAIPAGFYGFAAIFALLLLKGVDAPSAAIGPTIISIIIGAAFGYVSEIVIDVLAKKDAAPAPAAA